MVRGLRSPAASAIRCVEAGVKSGVEGLIRPHLKPILDDLQGFAQLIGSHLGGSGLEPSTWAVETHSRSQSEARMRALDGPSTTSQ